MICNKCNSEIPDGSRFCTVCGAPCAEAADVKPAAAQTSSGKYHCAKCGLELEQGAKFCTACGEPAANVSNVAPIANSGETFGNGSMATVSLEKEPDAGDLVAAMNSAASASQAPTAPKPAPVPTAAPAPSVNEAPSFVPSGNSGYAPSSVMGGYNGMSGAAAVVTAPPATKKKVSGGKIALIIAIVLIVLIGGAAAFFFTNKAVALSFVMGKPKYAAMVEKQSLKEAAEKLDTAVLSGQIKTFSSIMSTMGADDIEDMFPSIGLTNSKNDAEFAKLMSAAGNPYADIKGLLKGYNEFMQSTYGASRIYGNISADISLGSKIRDEIGDEADTINYVLDMINGAEITYDVGLNEKQAGMEFGIKLGSKPINIKAIITDDGSEYVMFPFASDKALKYTTIDTDDSADYARDAVVLDFDEKEISRLLGELIEIYTDYIKESSVTMEKGGLVAAGVPVEGRQITADIGGEKLEGLIRALFEHIANDTYFRDKLVEYINSFDPSYTAEDFKNDIIDAGPEKGDLKDSDRLIVTTIVNNGGDILAKSYKLVSSGKNLVEMLLAEDGKIGAAELKEDGKTTFTVISEATSDTDGTVTLNVGTDDNESVGIIVTYSGVDKTTFGKTEVPVGSYTLKFDVSGVHDMNDEEKAILGGFSLALSNSVESGTEKTTMSLDIKDYLTANISVDATLSNDMSVFDPPANAIDIEEYDDDTAAQLDEFGQEILAGLTEALEGTPLEDLISQALMGAGSMSPNYDFDNNLVLEPESGNTGSLNTNYEAIEALEERVWAELSEVYDWYDEYGVYSGTAFDNAQAYQDKLRDLDAEIWDVYYDCTDAEYNQLAIAFATIILSKEDIRGALEADSEISDYGANTAMAGEVGVRLQYGQHYGRHSGYCHYGQNHCGGCGNCPYYQ